VSGELLVIIFT